MSEFYSYFDFTHVNQFNEELRGLWRKKSTTNESDDSTCIKNIGFTFLYWQAKDKYKADHLNCC